MRVLLVRFECFSGLAYYGFETKKVSKTNRESVQSHSIKGMLARLVSRASFQWNDQLAVTPRQRGVPAPLLRMDLKLSTTPVRWLRGEILICVVIVVLASPFIVLSTSPTRKSAQHTR